MSGHLFVVHGDMTRLSCDGLVVPCDGNGNIATVWRELVPDARESRFDPSWITSAGFRPGGDGTCPLPSHEQRSVTLVDTVSGAVDLEAMVQRVVRAVHSCASDAQARAGRHRKLVALPLVGTGAGGQSHRRRVMIRRLLPALLQELRTADLDVALVLRSRQDYAAVQTARAEMVEDNLWEELGALSASADELGIMASKGELSLFMGSGVSVPVGLPDWRDLLGKLHAEARLPGVPAEDDHLGTAQDLKRRLGETRYTEILQAMFDRRHHALGHALIADLGATQMVTTNYDPCLELALDPVLGDDGYRVLTRHVAEGGKPWLLKFHGDVRRPETMVLTQDDYDALRSTGAALHGVVQGLMLTSHLLFVGFSLTDADFVELAHKVRVVRRAAEGGGEGPLGYSGTALALTEHSVGSGFKNEVRTLPMTTADDDVSAAARRLEVFLDRVAYTAAITGSRSAEFLLDPSYFEEAAESDVALREAMLRLAESARNGARSSSAWPLVRRLLESLGMPADQLPD